MLDAVTMALERDRKRRDNERAKSNLRIRFEALTPREREVMALVTAGLMNKQIAAETNLAEITVKIHRGHVMKKMAARSLADLVRMAEILDIRSSEQRCDCPIRIPMDAFSAGSRRPTLSDRATQRGDWSVSHPYEGSAACPMFQ
jgi:DNA-binding CsgD family transcriptional regulator